MSYPVDLQSLQHKLQQNTPGNYRLDWAVSKESHIRFKVTTTKDTAIILNHIWAKAIAKVTGSKYTTQDKYLRLNADFLDDTVTFTIYPNGTIMLQGISSHKWADRYIEKIYTLVQSEIEENKQEMKSSEDSSILEESATEVKGICAVCDQENNDEMVHCDIKSCNAWIHNTCEGLSEKEAQEIKPYYCSQCRSTYNLKTTTRSREKSNHQVSSKLYTSLGISNISEEVLEENTALDESSALQYLKTVHQSLIDMNEDEEDETSDDSAIEELKDLTKNVAQRFKLAIEEEENNTSKQSLKELQTPTQIPTPKCVTQINETNSTNNNSQHNGILSTEKKLIKSQNHNKSLNDRLQAVTKRLISTEGGLAKANREIDRLNTILKAKEENENDISNVLTEKNNEIKDCEKNETILRKTIDNMQHALLEKDREIDRLHQQNSKVKEKLNDKSKEIEELKANLHQVNTNKNCNTELHNIEGYCEFRHQEEVTQIRLNNMKLRQENEALSQQVHFDNYSKENLNTLLEKADYKIKKLKNNENALIKRHNDLIQMIDTMNKEAYTENLPSSNRDWSVIDATEGNLSNEAGDKEIPNYRDALVSTPKPPRKNSNSSQTSNSTSSTECAERMKTNNKNTTGRIADMLNSLTSQLQKYFDEKSQVSRHEDTWNVKNHDPYNLRKRPVCKFLTSKGCYSARCIYYHPPNGTTNPQNPPSQETSTPMNRQNKKDEICWFYQRNQCRYEDNQCRYQHPPNY